MTDRNKRRATPPQTTDPAETEPFVATVLARIAEKKGENTVVLDVSAAPVLVDTFIVTEVGSAKQLRALARHLKDSITPKPAATEGMRSAAWAVLDYGTTVVHVMEREARAFYDLEGLWELAASEPASNDSAGEGS